MQVPRGGDALCAQQAGRCPCFSRSVSLRAFRGEREFYHGLLHYLVNNTFRYALIYLLEQMSVDKRALEKEGINLVDRSASSRFIFGAGGRAGGSNLSFLFFEVVLF